MKNRAPEKTRRRSVWLTLITTLPLLAVMVWINVIFPLLQGTPPALPPGRNAMLLFVSWLGVALGLSLGFAALCFHSLFDARHYARGAEWHWLAVGISFSLLFALVKIWVGEATLWRKVASDVLTTLFFFAAYWTVIHVSGWLRHRRPIQISLSAQEKSD